MISRKSFVVALATVTSISTVGLSAFAVPPSPSDCHPSMIALNNNNTAELGIACTEDIGWFRARNSNPGCYAAPMDLMKSWLSIAQAAMLSGKKVSIKFSVCNSIYQISELVLVQ
jgi:hypothetical protein